MKIVKYQSSNARRRNTKMNDDIHAKSGTRSQNNNLCFYGVKNRMWFLNFAYCNIFLVKTINIWKTLQNLHYNLIQNISSTSILNKEQNTARRTRSQILKLASKSDGITNFQVCYQCRMLSNKINTTYGDMVRWVVDLL